MDSSTQPMVTATEARLQSHEAVCAERYTRIDAALADGEKHGYAGFAFIRR